MLPAAAAGLQPRTREPYAGCMLGLSQTYDGPYVTTLIHTSE